MTTKKFIFHKPTNVEIFYALEEGRDFCRLLLNQNKAYQSFLESLFSLDFLSNHTGVTIKLISEKVKLQPKKVTKWLGEIYWDIFELNSERPELFSNDATIHKLSFKHYDNSSSFCIGLKATPRKFEEFQFNFISAKVGTNIFWVQKVKHEIENGKQLITVFLKGGELNTYREQLIDKALFEGTLHYLDVMEKYDFQIDEILKKKYL